MARNFNAATEKIDLGYIASLDVPSSFWVSAWLKMDALTQDGAIITTLETAVFGGWIFFFDDSNPIGIDRVELFLANTANDRVASSAVVPVDEWHHWLGQYDAAADEVRLYKDGVLDNTSTGATDDPNTTSENVYIGLDTPNDSATRQLLGSVAHAKAGLGVLSVGEIQSVFRNKLGPSTLFDLGLEGINSPEPDSSGNKVNGTVTGASRANGPPVAPYSSRLWGSVPLIETAGGDVTVAPGLATLTITAFAPTIQATDHQTVSPGLATLSLTAFAPTIGVTDHQTVAPGLATLSLAAFAPTIGVTDHQTVSPGVATLTLTAFAPTLGVTDHITVSPGVASLSITAFAPTIAVTAHVPVNPGLATMTITAFAPTVAATGDITVAPGVASLTLTAFAPTIGVTAHVTVAPGVASLSLTTFAPTIGVTDHQTVAPGVAALSLTAFAPTIQATDHQTVSPGVASLSLASFAPTIGITDHITIQPGAAALILSAFAPTIQLTGNILVAPPVAALSLTAFAPTVASTLVLVAIPVSTIGVPGGVQNIDVDGVMGIDIAGTTTIELP